MKTLFAAAAALLLAVGPAAAEEPPAEVKLPLAQYEALVKAQRDRGGPQATWGTGDVTIRVPEGEGRFASVEVTANVRVIGDGLGEVLLLPGDVILEEARIDSVDATLLRRGGAHVALLTGGNSSRSVRLSYQVPTRATSSGGQLAVIPLPPLPGSTLRVDTSAANGAAVEVWPSGKVTSDGGGLRGSLPQTAAIVVRWGAGSDIVRRSNYRLKLDPGSDGVDIDATYEVEVDGQKASVKLAPSTVALTEVVEGGKPVNTKVVGDWHMAIVEGPGRHTLTASFRIAIDRSQGQPEVTLTTVQAPITLVEAEIPGKRAVTFDPAVPVKIVVTGEGDAAVTVASGYLPPTDEVTIQWTEPRTAPEKVVSANTETYQLVSIEEGVLRSKVHVRYEIIRGTLKELPVQLPDGVVLYKVNGDGIEDWRTFAATADEPRQARIFLGAERDGAYELTLELEQVAPTTVGQPLNIPIVRPLGASREMGVVALFDGKKVGFAPATQSSYTKAGEDALPVEIRQGLTDIMTQAFKHLGEPGAVSSAVSAPRTREIRFDARVETLYAFQQNALEARSTITLDIKSGRTDRIVLSLPRGVKVGSDVNAPSLKKADWVEVAEGAPETPRREYEVLLTRALEGTFDVELNLELILDKKLGQVDVPDIRVVGADVQKGDFGVSADSGVEVSQSALAELRKVDVAELPNAVRLRARKGVQLGYSYSYVSEPWSLTLDVKRHKTVDTLNAAITAAWLETTVFEEGQIITSALYRVDNRDQPYLRLRLPADTKVLTVASNGAPADAIADESDGLKISLPKQSTSLVEVVTLKKRDGLSIWSSLDLGAPTPDVFVKDFQWLVLTPKAYSSFGVDSALKEVPADGYRPPNVRRASGSQLAVQIAPSGPVARRLFKADVYDASDKASPPLTISMSLMGGWLSSVLLLVALLLLAFAVWRRASGRGQGGAFWGALLLGLALLVWKAVLWGLGGGEALLIVAVLGGVAFGGWLMRRNRELLDA